MGDLVGVFIWRENGKGFVVGGWLVVVRLFYIWFNDLSYYVNFLVGMELCIERFWIFVLMSILWLIYGDFFKVDKFLGNVVE